MKHIVKSAFFITLGGALPLLASVILLIPYTENLHTADYGALAIYISFSLLVQILMNYGVDSYLAVHYYDHKDDPSALRRFLGEITGGLLVYSVLLMTILCLLSWITFPYIFPDGNISFWPYGFMSILTGFFNAWFRMYVNVQIYADKPRKYFWFGLFNLIVTVGISTWLVYANPFTLIGPMWGRMLSGVLIFLLTFGYGLREYGIRLNPAHWKPVKAYSTPIVVFSLLTWVLGYINNYILNALATPADVGVYDFATKATILLEYLAIGVLGAITPRVFQLWKKDGANATLPEESRYYHAYSAVNVLAIAVLILLLPFVVKVFIHNEAYHVSIQYMPLLCLSFVFRPLQGLLLNPIYFQKKTQILPKQLVVTASVQIVSTCVFVLWFGVWGAVWGIALAKFIQIIILYRSVKPFYRLGINTLKMIYLPLIYFLVVMTLGFSGIEQKTTGVVQLILACCLVISVYRKEVQLIPAMLRGK